jgi:membrane protease YdiL (CAAX protease family)
VRILVAAVISEGILVALALALQSIFSLQIVWNAQLDRIAWGVVLVLPPLAMNHILWRYSERHPNSVYQRFSQEVIIPLCQRVSWQLAVLIAILSGACEELFFRGALHQLLLHSFGLVVSCAATSLLFASVHFIGSVKRYGRMIPLYAAMGAYLWCVQYALDSLAAVAVLHGVYNFIVIMLVKRQAAASLMNSPTSHSTGIDTPLC